MVLPSSIRFFLEYTGDLARFTGRYFGSGFSRPFETGELLKQCYNIGYKLTLAQYGYRFLQSWLSRSFLANYNNKLYLLYSFRGKHTYG